MNPEKRGTSEELFLLCEYNGLRGIFPIFALKIPSIGI